MSLWRRLKYLIPSYRRVEERDMQEESDSLKELASPGEMGSMVVASENARDAWGWSCLDGFVRDARIRLRTADMVHGDLCETWLARFRYSRNVGDSVHYHSLSGRASGERFRTTCPKWPFHPIAPPKIGKPAQRDCTLSDLLGSSKERNEAMGHTVVARARSKAARYVRLFRDLDA